MGLNWYPLEFQQIFGRLDFQNYIDAVYQKLGHLFNVNFRVLVRVIKMVSRTSF